VIKLYVKLRKSDGIHQSSKRILGNLLMKNLTITITVTITA